MRLSGCHQAELHYHHSQGWHGCFSIGQWWELHFISFGTREIAPVIIHAPVSYLSWTGNSVALVSPDRCGWRGAESTHQLCSGEGLYRDEGECVAVGFTGRIWGRDSATDDLFKGLWDHSGLLGLQKGRYIVVGMVDGPCCFWSVLWQLVAMGVLGCVHTYTHTYNISFCFRIVLATTSVCVCVEKIHTHTHTVYIYIYLSLSLYISV